MDELKLFDNINKAMIRIPKTCATLAVVFSKDRFWKQNWIDGTVTKWPKRKRRTGKPSDSRAILIKSGRLRRSIRKVTVSSDYFVIGTDVPYAKIHNEGGRMEGTEIVRTHRRRAHIRKNKRVREATVKAHMRRYSRSMPKRQFIGESEDLNKKISRSIGAAFKNAIKRSITG